MNVFRFKAGRWTGVIALALIAGLVSSCGKNRVTVEVDVDSFMKPTDLTKHYVAPPVPPGISLPSIEIAPVAINLFEGANEFGNAEEISLSVDIVISNTSGSGSSDFTLFFHNVETGVYDTTPIAALHFVLAPGADTPASVTFDADQRILDLFTQDKVWLGLRFGFESTSTDPLEGDYLITSIRARVVSTVEVF